MLADYIYNQKYQNWNLLPICFCVLSTFLWYKNPICLYYKNGKIPPVATLIQLMLSQRARSLTGIAGQHGGVHIEDAQSSTNDEHIISISNLWPMELAPRTRAGLLLLTDSKTIIVRVQSLKQGKRNQYQSSSLAIKCFYCNCPDTENKL